MVSNFLRIVPATGAILLSLSAVLPADAAPRRSFVEPVVATSAGAQWRWTNFEAGRNRWRFNYAYANACASRPSLTCPGFIVMGVAF